MFLKQTFDWQRRLLTPSFKMGWQCLEWRGRYNHGIEKAGHLPVCPLQFRAPDSPHIVTRRKFGYLISDNNVIEWFAYIFLVRSLPLNIFAISLYHQPSPLRSKHKLPLLPPHRTGAESPYTPMLSRKPMLYQIRHKTRHIRPGTSAFKTIVTGPKNHWE